uniref:F-box domain-containing protein n=1 Tax=Rhodnius prolixus TaxID=13249 RepID=A0A4P6D7T9_RHOPR
MSDNVDVEINKEDKEVVDVNMSVENNHSAENGCCSTHHLLVVDGTPSWLDFILQSLDNPTTKCADAFISTLYILIYESGFTIDDGPINTGLTFNIQVMRKIVDYKFLHRLNSSYKLSLTLNTFPNNCIIVAIPVENIMIVNFNMANYKTLSLSFNMNDFVDLSGAYPKIKNGKQLSCKFNTALSEIRTRLVFDEVTDPKHILSLPTEILLDICSYLTPPSYLYFSLSCKRIYYRVFNDESVWSKIGRLYLPCRRRSNETWKDFVHYQFLKSQKRLENPLSFFLEIFERPFM